MLQARNGHLSISCVITAHSEGIILHTTLLSYEAMRVYAEERGASVEWVIVLDAADAETVRVAKNHPSLRPADILLYVDNYSASKSRNAGIAAGKGDIVAILNGDDYCTRDFLFSAAMEVATHPECVVHPHYVVAWGEHSTIRELPDQRNHPEVDAAAMVFQHPYISTVVAQKAVFVESPYAELKDGFCFADWHWSCEVMAAGYKHAVARDSYLFHRAKKGGLPEAGHSALLPPTRLFDQEYIKTPSREEKSALTRCCTFIAGHILQRWIQKSERTLARWKRSLMKRSLFKSASTAQKLNFEELTAFKAACMELVSIEPKLHPTCFPSRGPEFISHLLNKEWGGIFLRVSNICTDKNYDVVYVVLWLIAGGADLMILNQANACSRMGKNVLVIATENIKEHVWASRLDKNITFLPLGGYLKDLPLNIQQDFLCKLLLQINSKHIHCINSILCHKVFILYNKLLKYTAQLYASFYADGFRQDNTREGFIVEFLREEYAALHKIVCDNTIIPKSWPGYYGIALDKFHALYGLIPQMPLLRGDCTTPKILWAGRICKEKRPDLLLDIARSLPDMDFHIYGGKYEKEQEQVVHDLTALPNVVMHGPYSGFASLPISDFFCLLYTSGADGLPNVLLETASTGLPIVGSVVGGIGDFLTEETGYPVQSNKVADFVDALRHVYANPEQAHARADKARELVQTRHSEEAFHNSLRQLYSFED